MSLDQPFDMAAAEAEFKKLPKSQQDLYQKMTREVVKVVKPKLKRLEQENQRLVFEKSALEERVKYLEALLEHS